VSAFQVTRIDEIEPTRGVEGSEWIRIRRELDVEAFGVNAYRAKAGNRVIEEHDELGSSAGKHEELYLVHAGHATFTVGGEEIDAPAGTLVFVRDPATRRGAIAQEDGTTVLVVGGKPGEAYAVAAWEKAADAYPLWETKEFEKAKEILREVAEEHPDSGGVIYNLACAECLSGETDEALEHLQRALELDPKLIEIARTDSDFDAIRDRDEFTSLLAGEPKPAG
jgi:tetratricopeptide (TPR) repeat protein